MRFLSLFSGIEAASLAWLPLGWEAVAFVENDPFASAVLAHHYPSVPNLGDITRVTEEQIRALGPIDLVVFGFPCQDLSVAGQRKGLHDGAGEVTRSGLFFDAARIVRWSRCRWFVAENVPGLLSSKGGGDFALVLSELTGLDISPPPGKWQVAGVAATDEPGQYSVAWRCLDAQYFGLAQRRRRVFLVGCLGGDWRGPVAILFERESLSGHPAPRRPARQESAGGVAPSLRGGGPGASRVADSRGQDCVIPMVPEVAPCLTGNYGKQPDNSDTSAGPMLIPEVAGTLGGGSGSRGWAPDTDRMTFGNERHAVGDIAPTLRAGGNRTGGDRPPGTDVDTVESLIPIAFDWQASISDAKGEGKSRVSITRSGDYAGSVKPNRQDAVAIPILEAGARTGASTTDPRAGLGVGADGDPMFTLQAGKQHAVSVALRGREGGATAEMGGEVATALRTGGGGGDKPHVLALRNGGRDSEMRPGRSGIGLQPDVMYTLQGEQEHALVTPMAVRRLTPQECEKLQGFPPGHTDVPYRGKRAADGPRYRAIGNSMAVPCVTWIGRRLATVDALLRDEKGVSL